MTYDNLQNALDANRPFTITMADGKEYHVPHRDFISFSAKRTTAIVTTEDDRLHYLPLITMTALTQAATAEQSRTGS